MDDLRIKEFILAAPDKQVNELMDERVIALNVTRRPGTCQPGF